MCGTGALCAHANGNGGRAGKHEARFLDDTGADVDHCAIRKLGVGGCRRISLEHSAMGENCIRSQLTLLKLARIGIDLGEASEEVDMRNLDFVKLQVERNMSFCRITLLALTHQHATVVGHGVAGLGTNVHNRAARQQLASLHVPQRHDERVGTAVDKLSIASVGSPELSHHDGVICRATESSNPPLHGGQSGRLKGKSLRLGVVSRGRLQTLDVGAVSKLGLGVATDDFEALGGLVEHFALLVGSLISQSLQEPVQRGSIGVSA